MRRVVHVVAALIGVAAVIVPATSAGSTQFPGINGRIAFMSTRDDAHFQIYSMAADGSDVRRLTNNSEYNDYPSYSPDGSKIVYDQSTDGLGYFTSIFRMDSDGSGAVNLTPHAQPYQDRCASYSPDGTRIVFQSDRSSPGVPQIFVMDADGSNQVALTNGVDRALSPTWSPDGTKIAYWTLGTGSAVWVMNADGSGAVRVSPLGMNAANPNWSPDGTKIAFDSNQSGHYEIWTMNPDGTQPLMLTTTGGEAHEPFWSPDGRSLVFWVFANSIGQIYTVNVDGTGLTNISNGVFDDEDASWQSVADLPTTTTTSAPAPVRPAFTG